MACDQLNALQLQLQFPAIVAFIIVYGIVQVAAHWRSHAR